MCGRSKSDNGEAWAWLRVFAAMTVPSRATISWSTDAAYRKLEIRGAIKAWRRLDELDPLDRVTGVADAE